jgi:predicted permease
MQDRDTRFMGVVGRLEPGVSLEAARSRMSAAMQDLVREWPVENEGNGIRIDPLRAVVLGDAEPAMLVLLGAVLLLLLLSCASVANLLLARLSSRAPELAMRRALGAGRIRLVAHLLGESMMLAAMGGTAGLALAAVATRVLAGVVPADLPRAGTIGFDPRTFAFVAAVTLLSGLLFGVVPALRGSGQAPAGLLRGASSGAVARSRHGLLRALVSAQVGITVVLLVCGGLLVNSFARLASVDPGLDTDGVVTLRVNLPATYEEPGRIDAFFAELVDAARALPGVSAAGATWALPFTSDWASGRITVQGDPRPRGQELMAGMIPVRGDYFEATGMHVVEGRVFDNADDLRARTRIAASGDQGAQDESGLAVLNEAAARAMWPGAPSVVGRRFRYGRADETDEPWVAVIGVVQDARRFGLAGTVEPEIYQLHAEALWANGMSLVVRSEGDALALVALLRRAVSDLDKSLAVMQVGLLEDFVRRSLSEPRFRTLLVLAFGLASLALALAGVYGVLAFVVSLRTREIGVRMALGAPRGRMIGDVLRDGSFLIAAGVAFGLLGAAAGAGVLRSQLFGIGPFDPATWIATVGLVVLMGVAASWLPARRASRVSPAVAMREQVP